ncbi:MAG TPA: NAD(P)-binding protein, partial [Candidatus Obscuribacter sp.]|nr:NAD(P)-binding protein [Candidatus Obscuribacter sp.]
MKSIGIVGSGIAGLGLAYQLRDRYDITIFEGNSYVGGHTNTIDVDKPSSVAFDTGFMVFNHVTYPLLTSLFQELNVETCKTDMSFSVQHKGDRLEWNGAGLDAIFADRRNLLNLRFWRMLLKLDWFNKNAPEHLQDPQLSSLSISDYVARYQLGADFLNWYLVPMGASVWSTPLHGMLEFP